MEALGPGLTYTEKIHYTKSSTLPGLENLSINNDCVAPMAQLTKALLDLKVIAKNTIAFLTPTIHLLPDNLTANKLEETEQYGGIRGFYYEVPLRNGWNVDMLHIAL